MDTAKKVYSFLLLAILVVSNLILVESAFAQSIIKPSVPEFTIRYVEHPFDVATTYQIDEYSGENKTLKEGYPVQNRSIELIIQNQPFKPIKDSKGNLNELFYNISAKGNYGSVWHYYPTWLRSLPVTASDQQFTVLSFGLDSNYEDDNQYGFWYGDLSTGDKVDFRVQALVGYYNYPLYNRTLEENGFNGLASEWSNTQTIAIPETDTSTSTSPNPTQTSIQNPSSSPTVPESSLLVVLPLFAFMFLISSKFLKRKCSIHE